MCFLNAPKKGMARLHIIISFLLIIASVVFCFMPLAKINISEENSDQIESIMQNVDGQEIYDALGDLNVEIEITALKLTKCVNVFIMLADAGSKASSGEIDQETKQNLKSTFLNADGSLKEGMKDVGLISASILAPVFDKLVDPNISIASLLTILAYLGAIILLFVVVLLMPVLYGLLALISLIQFFLGLANPEKNEPRIAGKVFAALTLPLTLLLIPSVAKNIEVANGTLYILIVTAAAALINVIFSHTHKWENGDQKLIGVTQITSIVSIAGFAWFFYNIMKTGIVYSLFNGSWADAVSASTDLATTNFMLYLDVALVMVSAVLVIISTNYLKKSLKRISLSGKYSDEKMGSCALALAIVSAFSLILPFVITKIPHVHPETREIITVLNLTAEQQSAFLMAAVGIAVMIISEILLLVLKGIFCKDR